MRLVLAVHIFLHVGNEVSEIVWFARTYGLGRWWLRSSLERS